ncbi:MAG TPA: T9SS type A sorting domain-containing protein, partial [Flavobacteriales bacterium]|nr:T9SS type A sorting domain-containing protein [Flavobacteriales bacterium]
QWSRQAGGSQRDYAWGIDLGQGLVLLSGETRSDTTWFGDLPLMGLSWLDPYVTALDEFGNWLWTKSAGAVANSGYGDVKACAVMSDGSILATGTTTGAMDFDGHPYSSVYFTGFLGKLSLLSTTTEQFGRPELRLWPNPAHAHLTLQRHGDDVCRWSIVDATGCTVRSSSATGRSVQLSVEDLASGLYALRVVDRKGISVAWFMKQ